MPLIETIKHWFADGVFRRIFKNAALLLSGRAANGVLGLVTLSLMAQGLGVERFGLVILAQTYVLVIAGLTTFQSWQAVIRYGAGHLQNNNRAAFQSLIKFTSLLDVLGVVVGAVIGYLAVPVVGPWLEWDAEMIGYAQPFSLLILFTMVATPTGLLRLFDRFDVLSWQTTITPLLRLMGVAVAVVIDAPIWAYLLAWFVAGVVGNGLLVVLGWREAARRGVLGGMTWSLRDLSQGHDGIWKFSFASNFYSSLQLITGHMATFLVGIVAGPAAAGLYKIGRDVATALTKPAEMLNQSIYPEFAKLGATGTWHEFTRLILRGGALAGGAGVLLLLLSVVAGKAFLGFFFGPDFIAAYAVLVLLIAAATLTVTGFSMDPALYAMGRPGIPLRVNFVSIILIFLPLLAYLGQSQGPVGAGLAALIAATVTFIATAVFTVVELRKRVAPSA
ncbi:MAG: oligosaccharide flippase family protein [Rhodospirillaceae bacterium]|nr:oligosaccharide flippase family protein [Rhodospirillaceae bacterium]